ncbi:MAG: SDR family NAD(P)-dependent oxidoreductase [Candidatus Lokiarchaeota archaeon]|nr:SDR family NAD(P)-dependent oxidoreductase [Candidatus Lokiarchaeota archaeon]
MDKVLITGTTSGLGASLSRVYESNCSVHSISRNKPDHYYWDVHRDCDLANLNQVERAIKCACETNYYKYVFLNAGILGQLAESSNLDTPHYKAAFDINVWSNKIIIDELLKTKTVENIICISSGAASKGYYGWSIYCATKAAIKQLMSCYAIENPEVNFLSLAPGLVKTKMQNEIQQYDERDIPSVKKFKEAYETMQTPDECAKKIYKHLDSILEQKQDFFDLRNL